MAPRRRALRRRAAAGLLLIGARGAASTTTMKTEQHLAAGVTRFVVQMKHARGDCGDPGNGTLFPLDKCYWRDTWRANGTAENVWLKVSASPAHIIFSYYTDRLCGKLKKRDTHSRLCYPTAPSSPAYQTFSETSAVCGGYVQSGSTCAQADVTAGNWYAENFCYPFSPTASRKMVCQDTRRTLLLEEYYSSRSCEGSAVQNTYKVGGTCAMSATGYQSVAWMWRWRASTTTMKLKNNTSRVSGGLRAQWHASALLPMLVATMVLMLRLMP